MTVPMSKIRDLSFKTSIYGIEERIVLDIGSCYLKCGFSGEARPRHFLSMFLSEEALDDYLGLNPVHRQHLGHECGEICNERTTETCRGNNPLEVSTQIFLVFTGLRSCSVFFLSNRDGDSRVRKTISKMHMTERTDHCDFYYYHAIFPFHL